MMKKLLALILFVLVILSACGTSKPSSDGEIRIIRSDLNICNNGELYHDDKMRTHFIDFTTMKSALLCSKPNCPHDDSAVCSSYGMFNGVFLYGENIYFFDNDITMKNGKAEYVTKLIRANVDGTDRITVVEMNGRNSEYYDQRYLAGDTLFFTTEKVSFDEFNNSTSYRAGYLCSYDFKSGKYTEHLKAIEGWNSGVRICGVYDGGVFYNTSCAEEEIPWQNFLDPGFEVEFINNWYRYDIESGEVERIDYEVFYGHGGYCVKQKDGVSTLYAPSGTTRDITFQEGYYTIVNGKLFDAYGETVLDIESGRKYKMLTGDNVIYYIDGEYVTKGYLLDEDGFVIGDEYKRLSAEEIIGEEMS